MNTKKYDFRFSWIIGSALIIWMGLILIWNTPV